MNLTGKRGSGVWTVGVAIIAALVVLSGVAVVPTQAAGETTIGIQPADENIDVGGTTTVAVVLTDAQGGVGAAEIAIEVDDPAVATITDANVLGTGATDVEIADDGSSVDVEYAFRDTADTGSVTMLEVTVQGEADGVTDLSLVPSEGNDAVLAFDENGAGYAVTGTSGASITVESDEPGEPGPPALPGLSNQPTDPDGDGRYEDVDGDGEVRFNDVVELFEHFSSEAVEDNVDAFDFNENGRLDFDDIIRLFLSV